MTKAAFSPPNIFRNFSYNPLLKSSILDIKSSKRLKLLQDIDDYFYQTSAYAQMIEELYGLTIESLVIIMGVDNENCGFTYEQSASDWKQKTIELFVN